MKRIRYQTVYLWTCPDCGCVWQPRRRPRAGRDLVCVPHAEQVQVTVAGFRPSSCGAVNVSDGLREGIAPTVNL